MLEGLELPRGGNETCKVQTVLDTLSASDKAIFMGAVDSLEWPIKALTRELAKRGIRISDTPLGNHRKKACVCFRA